MQRIRALEYPARFSSVNAARLALGLPIVTVALLGALHVASPQFDPSWRMVSEYALGRYPWLLSLFFVSWAIGTWALVVAVRPQFRGRVGTAGLAFLVLAGVGEAMAAVFDINQDVGHSVAGLLGILGLPTAAVLVTVALPHERPWAHSRRPLTLLAALTWLAVVSLVATLILMTVQVAQAYGGQLPSSAPATLPAGVFRLVGWADRLIVAANCLWVAALMQRVIVVSRRQTQRSPAVPARARVAASPAGEANR